MEEAKSKFRPDDDTVRTITTRFTEADAARDNFLSERPTPDDLLKNYKLSNKKLKKTINNNIRTPLTFEVVETHAADVSFRPFSLSISAIYRGTAEKAEKSKVAVTHWMASSSSRMKTKQHRKAASLYGTSVRKLFWDRLEKDVITEEVVIDPETNTPLIDLETGEPVTKGVPLKVRIIDRPDFYLVDIKNWWVDPLATSMEDARYCFERRRMPKAELEKLLVLLGFDEDDAKELAAKATAPNSTSTDSSENSDKPGQMYNASPSLEIAEIIEYWDNEGHLAILTSKNEVVYYGDSIFDHGQLPYSCYRVHVPPGEFYGLGDARPLYALQEEMDVLHSQRRDNIDILINTPLAIRESSPAFKKEWKWGALARIPVIQQDDVRQIDMRDYTQTIHLEQSMLNDMARNAVGMSDYRMGNMREGMNKTASGTLAMISRADIRRDSSREDFEIEDMRRVANLYHQMALQFMDEDSVVHIIDPSGIEHEWDITRDDIDCDVQFEVDPNSTTLLSKEMQRQDALLVFQTLTGEGAQMALQNQGKMVDYDALLGIVFDSLGVRRKDAIIKPIEEPMVPMSQVKAMIEQVVTEMMAQGGGGGGNGGGENVPQTT